MLDSHTAQAVGRYLVALRIAVVRAAALPQALLFIRQHAFSFCLTMLVLCNFCYCQTSAQETAQQDPTWQPAPAVQQETLVPPQEPAQHVIHATPQQLIQFQLWQKQQQQQEGGQTVAVEASVAESDAGN